MHKKLPLIITLGVVGAILLAAAGIIIFGAQKHTTNARLNVVAAENVWGDIAAQIGGDRVDVTSVISSPNSDPHQYESGAKDASNIATADIVIINGLGYDDFMNKLLSASPNPQRVVINAAETMRLTGGDNPHAWYNIPRISQVADAIARELIAKDPAGTTVYQKNLATFNASLVPLFSQTSNIVMQHAAAPIAYTERVAEYLLTSAQLSIKTPAGFATAIEQGTEPSPSDQAAMTDLITNKQIRALIYNPQAESAAGKSARALAEQNGIPVVAMTETMPQNIPYQQWMLQQLDALAKALNNIQ